MPDPKTGWTVMQDEVEAYARTAMNAVEGITLHFNRENYPSDEACRKAALMFRNNFNTLKAKLRRHIRREFPEEPYANGAYDKLGCFIDRTETGWQVKLAKSGAAFGPIHAIDNATGEPVEPFRFSSHQGN